MLNLSIWETFNQVARHVGERNALLQDGRVVTFADVREQAEAVAHMLIDRGVTHRTVVTGGPCELIQPTVAIFSTDRPEMVATLLGAYLARAVPFTINYRYRAAEIRFALDQMDPVLIFTNRDGLAVLREAVALGSDPGPAIVCYDCSDRGPKDVVDYHRALSRAPITDLAVCTPDDRYLLLTGGTTGAPKAVVWRQADILMMTLGGMNPVTGREHESLCGFVDRAVATHAVTMSLPPLMHGFGQWVVLRGLMTGSLTVLPSSSGSFDPRRAVRICREVAADQLVLAGDAFALPLLTALAENPTSLPALREIRTGSVGLSPHVKRRLHEALPNVSIIESVGGSENAGLLTATTRSADEVSEIAAFTPLPGMAVIDEARTAVLPAGSPEVGWLSQSARVCLGYLNDQAATDDMFSTIDGVRYLVSGDRGRWTSDRYVALIGRGSQTINTGGEKVAAEEVDAVLRTHDAVDDVVTCGIPHERWGSQVASVVVLAPGLETSVEDLTRFARARLASYKVPRKIVVVANLHRSPVGKVDYRWARTVLTADDEGVAAPDDLAPVPQTQLDDSARDSMGR